jgi:hypothetical protein
VELRQAAGVAHLPGAAHQQDGDARLLGHAPGAGHDLTGGVVAAHGIDRHRQGGERLAGRPLGPPGH